MSEKSEYSKKVDIAKKRVGNVKGIDKKPLPKAKVRPTGNPLKGKIGVKITQKFSKGGMVKGRGKKAC